MKHTASTSNVAKANVASHKKPKAMISKIKSILHGINPRSRVFISIVGFVLILLLTFIFTILRVGSDQSQQTEVGKSAPTPFPPRVLIPGRDYVPGQLIVKFKEGATPAAINEILSKYNATVVSTIPGINSTVIRIPVGQEKSISESLSKEEIVKYAELDHVAHAQPNDTNFENQYGFKNTGQSIKGQAGTPKADVNIEPAWEVTKGSGILVAVLDTGLDMNHPDLASKISAQKVFMTATIEDKFGHGTHVAGTLSANTNNTQGIAGACPDCTLMIGKVLDDSGNGPYSKIAEGITWAADNNAKVINLSLGGYDNDNTLKEAVAYAWGKGSVLVAAAGNDNTTRHFFPGAYDNVVTVAAVDNKDKKASFSNYGDWVEVAAAGQNVFSTMPTYSYGLQSSKGTALNYDYISGTSMATPLVSGVAGLIWSTSYGTSNQAVVERIYSTAESIAGTGSSWTKGRVNAQAAVGAEVTLTPTVTSSPSATPTPTSVLLTPIPTSGLTPTQPVPTYVCGGSPHSICTSPTATPRPTNNPNPTISQAPNLTGVPSITPPINQEPGDDCLDVKRSTSERIREWVRGFLSKINNYIQLVLGNPQDPNRPAPPKPCIIR